MTTATALCNLIKTFKKVQEAEYVLSRSPLNQPADYTIGDSFTCDFQSDKGLWLTDGSGIVCYVPLGERQCFEFN